tara:strand:+ start:719 stop:949 length:231 start_codon:yes stop_codon:yes gene_type:complete
MVEKLYEIIAKIMGVPASEINDESSPETIESWDSFNSLLLADELESEFNISFSLEEIIDSPNVATIKNHLKNHGVS